jgi:hypothetical protein
MVLLEVALFAAPYLALVGLLALGRFPGERVILARRRVSLSTRPRVVGRGWPAGIERARVSLLERSSRRLRGPPVVA